MSDTRTDRPLAAAPHPPDTQPAAVASPGHRGSLHLNCPSCGLTITPRAAWLTVEHCPRCLARRGVAVPLFSSTLSADELYADGARPAAGARARHREA